jgi:hypothetical protein
MGSPNLGRSFGSGLILADVASAEPYQNTQATRANAEEQSIDVEASGMEIAAE